MKTFKKLPVVVLLAIAASFVVGTAVHAQQTPKSGGASSDVLEMRSVPAGNYLLTLQLDGQEKRLNIKVAGDSAKCVNSSDAKLKDIEGKFDAVGNGVFMIFFRNDTHRASQFWAFRKDGSATVKEVPDRGEKQVAFPVSDDSLESPAKP